MPSIATHRGTLPKAGTCFAAGPARLAGPALTQYYIGPLPHFFQEVTDAELLALAGPSQGDVDPALRLSSVVADSARRWLAATDDTASSSDASSIEDGSNNSNSNGNSSNNDAHLDEEAVIM